MTTKATDKGRRGRGSGGVQQRDRAGRVWRLWYDAPPGVDGKRRRRSETVRGTRVQAEQRLRAVLSSIDRNAYVEPTDETTGDYVTRWLGIYGPSLSPRTVKDYRSIVNRYIVPMLGHVPLAKLRAEHIQDVYVQLSARGLSPLTVTHVHRLLHQALAHAVDWDLLDRNPCAKAKPPRGKSKAMRSLDRSEVQTFMDAIEGSRYRDVYLVDLYTGLRRSEVLGLRWLQVDTENATVSVIHGLHRLPGRGMVLLPTKTASSKRRVDVPARVVGVLHEIRAHQMLSASETGLEWRPDGFVFATADGGPLDPEKVTHEFRARMDRAGLDGFRLHDLRHSFATLMLAAGEHPKMVQTALGHSSIQVTMDIYGHLMPGAGKEAAARLADFLDVT